MTKNRIALALVLAAITGGVIPYVVPAAWLGNILLGALVVTLAFCGLAAGSAQESNSAGRSASAVRVILWLVIGTDQPTAKVKDMQALVLFFAAIAFLVGFAIGAFGAVHV